MVQVRGGFLVDRWIPSGLAGTKLVQIVPEFVSGASESGFEAWKRGSLEPLFFVGAPGADEHASRWFSALLRRASPRRRT